MSKRFKQWHNWDYNQTKEEVDLENEKEMLKLYDELFPIFQKSHETLPEEMNAKDIEYLLRIKNKWRQELVKQGILFKHKVPFVDKVSNQSPTKYPREWYTNAKVIWAVEDKYNFEVGNYPPTGWRKKIKKPPLSNSVLPAQVLRDHLYKTIPMDITKNIRENSEY